MRTYELIDRTGTARWTERGRGGRHIGYDGTAVERASPEAELLRLVDDYRAQCLWFLREGYYPETPHERERVLALIAQHGDQRAFRRVAEVRTWLLQRSSGTSAGS